MVRVAVLAAAAAALTAAPIVIGQQIYDIVGDLPSYYSGYWLTRALLPAVGDNLGEVEPIYLHQPRLKPD